MKVNDFDVSSRNVIHTVYCSIPSNEYPLCTKYTSLTIYIVRSCRLLCWTGANEESNFGVDLNYLMIVIVKVQLLVVLEVGRGRLSEHLLVERT